MDNNPVGDFEARLFELSTVVFPVIDDAILAASDITDLPKQYHYLEFVMDAFSPDGVAEYLAQEPQHFAGFGQSENGCKHGGLRSLDGYQDTWLFVAVQDVTPEGSGIV